MIDVKNVGEYISYLRKNKGLTQNELGERLGISFQAVSKWERGETLPEVAILLDLANVLETSVDHILNGGNKVLNYKGRITVHEMREGILCLQRCGELLGKNNMIYQSAIEGINSKMNTNIELAFTDDHIQEVFVCEAILQNLQNGAYIDLSDVRKNMKEDKYKDIIIKFASKYDIK